MNRLLYHAFCSKYTDRKPPMEDVMHHTAPALLYVVSTVQNRCVLYYKCSCAGCVFLTGNVYKHNNRG